MEVARSPERVIQPPADPGMACHHGGTRMNHRATADIRRRASVAVGLLVAFTTCRPHTLQQPPGPTVQPGAMDPFELPPTRDGSPTGTAGPDPDQPGRVMPLPAADAAAPAIEAGRPGPPPPSVETGAAREDASVPPVAFDAEPIPIRVDAATVQTDTASGANNPACPSECRCELGFENGGADGWELLEYDGDVSPPATSSQLAHSGSGSLVISLAGSSRFGHFKLLRDICPGGTLDLRDKRISFWVQFDGLPSAAPDTYSGCEVQLVPANGIHQQVSDRVLWPVNRWHKVESTPVWSAAVRQIGVYCIVASPSGGGRVYIDDFRIE
jgi:hypothetical protein